jgi:hypothetical protein
MSRKQVDRYEILLTQKHESKMQEIRHERKTEDHRLEDLKKTLKVRIHAHSSGSRAIQAA